MLASPATSLPAALHAWRGTSERACSGPQTPPRPPHSAEDLGLCLPGHRAAAHCLAPPARSRSNSACTCGRHACWNLQTQPKSAFCSCCQGLSTTQHSRCGHILQAGAGQEHSQWQPFCGAARMPGGAAAPGPGLAGPCPAGASTAAGSPTAAGPRTQPWPPRHSQLPAKPPLHT